MTRIGLISDTHGLLRPEALQALEGVDRIIHGGDIGPPDLLAQLGGLAPLATVRGNNDTADWAQAIPETLDLDIDGCRVHVIHDLKQLMIDPQAEGVRVVVSGHSHKPKIETRDGVLYINPGSAGRRRFSLPVSLGELQIVDGEPRARIIELELEPGRQPVPGA